MNLRTLARNAAATTAVLLVGAPLATTTAQAAEAPACAKETLAYMEADDKAADADRAVDSAQDAVAQSERDQQTLNQTVEHINDLYRAVTAGGSGPLDPATQAHEALLKARKAAEEGDAAGVADAADSAAAAGRQYLKAVPGVEPVEIATEDVEKDAPAARKATTAKDLTANRQKLEQAKKDAATASEAVLPARTAVKTCLQNATA
ncbi:hypothetical protein ABZ128_03180 [Streptomyces sp. NPDC006326]|uniref:hypothetical protein n=1 Tax=Streptomyces sp. NPDC006326 TaxID=3156752 RepID=UPI0033B22F54